MFVFSLTSTVVNLL
jgi:hypothetical protein